MVYLKYAPCTYCPFLCRREQREEKHLHFMNIICILPRPCPRPERSLLEKRGHHLFQEHFQPSVQYAIGFWDWYSLMFFSHKKVMISDNWDTWWRESNDIDQYSIHEVIPWLSVFVALLTISLIIQIQRDSNSRNIKIEHKKQRDILEGIALGSETFHYLAICSFSCPSILLSPIY